MTTASVDGLLIENNPIHVRLIQELLSDTRSPILKLVIADSLAGGLRRLEETRVDLVLLDLTLPDSQDLETFIRVRARAPNLPIVIVTGVDDTRLAAKAVEAGAQDYLVKTRLSRTGLTRSLRYALERTRVRDAEWDAPSFRLAQRQFLKTSQLMELDDNVRQRLLFPQRTQVVCFPFRRDRYTEADEILNEKGVFILPDILANAGGVTVFPFLNGSRGRRITCGPLRR